MGVRADDLWCTIGKQTILREVNLHAAAPVTVVLGVNGAGKTTLFRVLAGLVPPTRGSVSLHHELGSGVSRDFSVGYLPQSPRPVRGLKVRQYLEYFAFLKRLHRSEAGPEVDRALGLVGLEREADKKTLGLSGGMMRRLGIGAAVLGSPDLVLLDEPTAGLDPEQRIRIRELVSTIAVDTPVLISTHLAEDTARLADEVVVLHEGRVVATHQMATASGRHALRPEDVEAFFLAAIREKP